MPVSDKGRAKYAETKRIIQQAMNEKQLVLFVGTGTFADTGTIRSMDLAPRNL